MNSRAALRGWMRLPVPGMAALSVAMLGMASVAAEARVVRVDVESRMTLAADAARPGVPAYEKIAARVYFAVRPSDVHNARIVDLDKAAVNAAGEVEFSADLFLMRPMSGGNGAMLLEIPNRGGKGLMALVDGGKADPASMAEVGDAWLLRQGFTLASLGWQWDVTHAAGNLRLYAPVAHEKNGDHITGLLRDDFTPTRLTYGLPLGHIMGGHLGGLEYPASAPDDARNVLTVRDTPDGARQTIPRARWRFGHSVGGAAAPYDQTVNLASGFQPGKIYELVYVVQDPVVAGLGFAAVRDFTAWMKHDPQALAPVRVAYAAGISQCGRFLRDFIYEGFNADEQGRMALDGVLAHVGGAGRGSFNYRFAQPSRDAQPMSSIDWPTDIFPYTDQPEVDPHAPQGGRHGLMDAAQQAHVMPKVFLSHTSYEYWGRAASLLHTTADGSADVAIGPDVRIYFYAGLQHFTVPFPPKMGTEDRESQQLPSPLPIRYFWRSMIANMDGWVQKGTTPPESRYPRLADGSLTPLAKLKFPAIAGMTAPTSAAQGLDLDFGPNWRTGILSRQPPVVDGIYPTRVPQVDADGNDLGGIRLPEMSVPLATYTGWNLRAPAIGAPTERTAFLGSFIPLPRTAAEAEATHDPRTAIAQRYKDYADYRGRFEKALDTLVGERYILAEDAGTLLDQSKTEWDWMTASARP